MSSTRGSSAGRTLAGVAIVLGSAVLASCQTTGSSPQLDAADPTPPGRIVTQGETRKLIAQNLTTCAHPNPKMNLRVAAVGEVTATDGTVIVTPAETALQKGLGPRSHDMYNECDRITPRNTAEVSTAGAPVIEIDPDGEVITGYIVADNYYEMYVNGRLVSVDSTPFTPFNSAIVKFRVKRPYTVAIMGVDWEEHMGLGMELFPVSGPKQNPWHPGDGGLIVKLSDGTVTDSSWKAQSFYIAPLNDPKEVVERGHLHDTTHLGRVHPVAKKPNCQGKCYAVRYPIPANWQSPRFNDSYWPRAYEYTDTDIGVRNLPAYTRYPELFEGARWIWSVNLVFDNLVIMRKTVR
ncbi:MAG: hypothetical protein IT529_02055 [Burkholderiales bacterium]|nr:hypothetical protein [Burkholderiales bacterium]